MEKKKEVNRSEVVQHVYCDLMPQGNILTLRDQTGTSVLHFRCAAVEIPFFFLFFFWCFLYVLAECQNPSGLIGVHSDHLRAETPG